MSYVTERFDYPSSGAPTHTVRFTVAHDSTPNMGPAKTEPVAVEEDAAGGLHPVAIHPTRAIEWEITWTLPSGYVVGGSPNAEAHEGEDFFGLREFHEARRGPLEPFVYTDNDGTEWLVRFADPKLDFDTEVADMVFVARFILRAVQ